MKLVRENITEELLEKNEHEKPKSMEELFEIIEKDFCSYYPIYGQDTKIEFLKSITNLDYFLKKVRDQQISKIYKEKAIIMITDIYIKFGILFYEKIKGKNEYCFKDLIFSDKEKKIFEIYYKKYFFIEKMDEFVLKDIILILTDISSKNLKKEELIKHFKINYNLLNLLKFFFKITDEDIFQEFLIRHIIKMSEKGIGFKKRIKRKHKILKYSNLNLEVKKLFKSQIENLFFTKQKLDKKYPNFREWLDKVYKEVEEDNTKREIFIFLNYYDLSLKIEGISILKKTKDEKKISYLYISEYQDVFEMFEIINKFLGTETPLFSIEKELFKGKYEYYLSSENAIEILKKIDKKLKFNLTSIVPNKYVVGKTELIFNEVGKNTININNIKENQNEKNTIIPEKIFDENISNFEKNFYKIEDNKEEKMLKREEITEELKEKYKWENPKSLKEIFNENIGTDWVTYRFKLIETLMNFYYSFNSLKGENIKEEETKYTILTVPDIDKRRVISDISDILLKYFSFHNSILKRLSEEIIYFEFTETFSEDIERYFKKLYLLEPFFLEEKNSIYYDDEIKKIILNIVRKISNDVFLIEKREDITLKKVDYISLNLKNVFLDILKLIFLFGIKLEEIYDEIFIKEILKKENLNEIKRHKVLKYSQTDLNTREILKDFFKNKTSQILKNVYPNFDEWFEKVLKEIEEDNTKREILLFINSDVVGIDINGIAILKNTEEEKKICYLFIRSNEDIDNVFEEIYNYLGTETPLITFEKEFFENKYKSFLKPLNVKETETPLITLENEYKKFLKSLNEEVRERKKLKFNLTSIAPDKYVKGKTELIFNEVGKEPIDLKGKSLDEVIKEIIEENLKKKEEIVETVNEETKEEIKN